MIQMFCDGVLLYDPRSADYIVAEPKCELEVNKTGNLTFRIAPTHPLYGQIQKLKSEIAVYQDNERLGAFRVLNVEQDFNNIKTVTCEGELAYLLDSIQRAAEYHDVTVAEYFAIVIANHNADVDSSKQFTVGSVTVTDPNDSLYRIHSYENTWECIEDKLLDRLGGYIRIRMSGNTRLIDYVTSYGNVNPQIIRFGENILDLVREVRGENVATVLVPLGAADEETGEKLTVKSVNDGLDYIEDTEAIQTYGRIVKTVEFDDVTVASNLLTKGYSELAKVSKPTVALYTIPRKSSCSMSATNLGSTGTISISRASSSFTHTLTYTFGNATGTIATKTSSTSVSWTPSLTLANQIPNSTSGTVTITCSTYNGITLIGSTTCTATLSVPGSVIPTMTSLTATRVDGTVPSSWGIYVQTKSKATLTINGAAGRYGSTISAYSITGGGFSGTGSSLTTGFLNTSGTITFTAKVKDSRGRWSAEKTVSISVVAYSPPTFTNYLTQRCNSSGTITTNGTYGRGLINFTYASCSSNNTITTAVAYKRSTESSYTTTSVTFSSGTAFIFGGGNMSTDYSYDIRYTLTDAFGSIIVVDSLSTASVLMDFKAGGTGIGVGKVAETDNLLDVGMNAKFRGTVSGKVASLDGYDSVIASDFNDYKEVGIYIVSIEILGVTHADRSLPIALQHPASF